MEEEDDDGDEDKEKVEEPMEWILAEIWDHNFKSPGRPKRTTAPAGANEVDTMLLP